MCLCVLHGCEAMNCAFHHSYVLMEQLTVSLEELRAYRTYLQFTNSVPSDTNPTYRKELQKWPHFKAIKFA